MGGVGLARISWCAGRTGRKIWRTCGRCCKNTGILTAICAGTLTWIPGRRETWRGSIFVICLQNMSFCLQITTVTRHKAGDLERVDQAQKIFEPKKGRRRTQHRNQLRARRNGRANTSGGRSTYVRTLSTYLRMYVRTYVKTYAIATYVRK